MPEKYILSTCLPLVAMPLSDTKPSRMLSGYFQLRHKAVISHQDFGGVCKSEVLMVDSLVGERWRGQESDHWCLEGSSSVLMFNNTSEKVTFFNSPIKCIGLLYSLTNELTEQLGSHGKLWSSHQETTNLHTENRWTFISVVLFYSDKWEPSESPFVPLIYGSNATPGGETLHVVLVFGWTRLSQGTKGRCSCGVLSRPTCEASISVSSTSFACPSRWEGREEWNKRFWNDICTFAMMF